EGLGQLAQLQLVTLAARQPGVVGIELEPAKAAPGRCQILGGQLLAELPEGGGQTAGPGWRGQGRVTAGGKAEIDCQIALLLQKAGPVADAQGPTAGVA